MQCYKNRNFTFKFTKEKIFISYFHFTCIATHKKNWRNSYKQQFTFRKLDIWDDNEMEYKYVGDIDKRRDMQLTKIMRLRMSGV